MPIKKTFANIIICSLVISSYCFISAAEEIIWPSGFRSHRISINKADGFASLPVEGMLVSKERHGDGIYHIEFMVNEDDQKFEWHAQWFFLFADMDKNADLSNNLDKANLRDILIVWWHKGGTVELQRRNGGKSTADIVKKLGSWIIPGTKKKSSYEAGELVKMTIVVNRQKRKLGIYLRKDKPLGKPDTTFDLPDDLPESGYFGMWNAKWYSRILVRNIRFTPMTKAP